MQNTLYTNDNLFILNGLNSDSVDLIYLDPPFNSKRIYSAPVGSKAAGLSFKDMWTWEDVNEAYLDTLAVKYPIVIKMINSAGVVHSKAMAAYLTYMAQRLVEMHRVLKDTGSIYFHCDPTASHYLKTLMDLIFGKNNFRNEIVWCYTGPSNVKKNFPAKHDIVLRYSKTEDYVFYKDTIRIEYKEATLERRLYAETKQKGIKFKGKPQEEYLEGRIPSDWWSDIPSGGQISRKERTGYPTQKPLALLNRIIKASSSEGDIIMDPFCGCATTCVAAQQLGRKWIGIDIEKRAVTLLMERLEDDAGLYKKFHATDKVPVRTDVLFVPPDRKSIKERLYKEQNGKCNGCGVTFEIRNLAVDHIIPVHHGGGSYYENYQLLCGNCNSVKGARPMEYLMKKVKIREAEMEQEVFFSDKAREEEENNTTND